MPTNPSILIAGGTGFFGNAFALMTLAKYKSKRLSRQLSADPLRIKSGTNATENFMHPFDNKKEWMGVNELQAWIAGNRKKIGAI